MMAARPKAALFSADKLAAPLPAGNPAAADVAKDASARLVAPPRTISDISAILDQQTPDPAAIAKLTSTADAAVPAGLKGAELADFYYKRAQARVLLGRADALDDAQLAVSNASTDDYKNLGSRYEQLLMRLLRDAGQQKQANVLMTKQMAAFAKQVKGKLFGLNYATAGELFEGRRRQRCGVVCRAQSRAADRSAALARVPDLRDSLAGHCRRR